MWCWCLVQHGLGSCKRMSSGEKNFKVESRSTSRKEAGQAKLLRCPKYHEVLTSPQNLICIWLIWFSADQPTVSADDSRVDAQATTSVQRRNVCARRVVTPSSLPHFVAASSCCLQAQSHACGDVDCIVQLSASATSVACWSACTFAWPVAVAAAGFRPAYAGSTVRTPRMAVMMRGLA